MNFFIISIGFVSIILIMILVIKNNLQNIKINKWLACILGFVLIIPATLTINTNFEFIFYIIFLIFIFLEIFFMEKLKLDFLNKIEKIKNKN